MTDDNGDAKNPEHADFVNDLYPLHVKFDELANRGHYCNIKVRPIKPCDFMYVKLMDNESGNNVYDMVKDYEEDECNDYAYGIFADDELIGYCTVGYAEGIYPELEKDNVCGPEDLCLSDVYVKEKYRRHGYGTMMVQKTIELEHKNAPNAKTVFATIFDNKLIRFYAKAGFTFLNESNGTICKELRKD
jgi:GNAT superfamily N-acetyltransferase